MSKRRSNNVTHEVELQIGENLKIGDEVTLSYFGMEPEKQNARLGVNAPPRLKVTRAELYDAIFADYDHIVDLEFGQWCSIGDNLKLVFRPEPCWRNSVKAGVVAPKEVRITRAELLKKKDSEYRKSSSSQSSAKHKDVEHDIID